MSRTSRELGEAQIIVLGQVSSLYSAHIVESVEHEKVQRRCQSDHVQEDKPEANPVQTEGRIIDSSGNSHSHSPTRHTSNLRSGNSFSPSNVVNGQLERIKIPVFGGNKIEFPRWHTAFSSCVDASSLSAQFKMLRLEGCLTAETIKGLGYSEAAYERAKARLLRKNQRKSTSSAQDI